MQFEKGQQFLQQSTFASNNFVGAEERKREAQHDAKQKYSNSLWKPCNN